MREIKTFSVGKEEALQFPIDEKVRSYIEEYGIKGEAVVGKVGDKPVFLVGLQEAFPQQMEAWVIFFTTYYIRSAQVIRNLLVDRFVSGKYVRISAAGAVDEPGHCRFIEWMGFEYEGTVRCYGPERKDYRSYSLINRR